MTLPRFGSALLVVAVCVATPRLAFCQAPGDPNRPASHLEFRELQHDFGRIHDAEPVEWKFGLPNSSAAAVTIADVHTSCGCTKTRLGETAIKPGASGEIVVSLNPANRQGKEKKTVSVRTDEPGDPRQQLVITAEV